MHKPHRCHTRFVGYEGSSDLNHSYKLLFRMTISRRGQNFPTSFSCDSWPVCPLTDPLVAASPKKYLAFGASHGDIAAVRYDLPHMPSLGVSSLDLGRLWRHRRPPFFRSLLRRGKIAPLGKARARFLLTRPPFADARFRQRRGSPAARPSRTGWRSLRASVPTSPSPARPYKERG